LRLGRMAWRKTCGMFGIDIEGWVVIQENRHG